MRTTQSAWATWITLRTLLPYLRLLGAGAPPVRMGAPWSRASTRLSHRSRVRVDTATLCTKGWTKDRLGCSMLVGLMGYPDGKVMVIRPPEASSTRTATGSWAPSK